MFYWGDSILSGWWYWLYLVNELSIRKIQIEWKAISCETIINLSNINGKKMVKGNGGWTRPISMVSSSKAEKLLFWKQKAVAVEYQKRRIFYKPRKEVKGSHRAEWKKKEGKNKGKKRRGRGREGGGKEVSPASSITLRKAPFKF